MSKPKSRIRRVTTGCRDCRRRRIKCPEGPLDLDGRKAPCARCQEGGVDCWYPSLGGVGSEWSRASDGPEDEVIYDECRRKRRKIHPALHADGQEFSPTWPVAGPSQSQNQICIIERGNPTIELASSSLPPTASTTNALVGGIANFFQLGSIRNPEDSSGWGDVFSPRTVQNLLHPHLFAPISTFTLASLYAQPLDRSAVSYFETRGCSEIVAASNSRTNWIHAMLLPRLLALLQGTEGGSHKLIRDYVAHSLRRLSLVHRGNVEDDPTRRQTLRTESQGLKQLAEFSLLQLKVSYPEHARKTEGYLMGFFVACMADMLDSKRFVIDRQSAFELPDESMSDFSASLRDMIGVYSTLLTACTPHEPLSVLALPSGSTAPFELALNGSEWVEDFFGVSRHMLVLIGRVNRLVINRQSLLRSGTRSGIPYMLVQAEAEKMSIELGASWSWNENSQAMGKSLRVQRGTAVTRSALLMMTLCELLDVDLDDHRLEAARLSALELVADTEPEETAGHSWALSIVAIYTRDSDLRYRLRDSLRSAQDWSFGIGYKGADDIMAMCWTVLDDKGRYPNGIAPWREVIAACGRSMYI